MNILSPALVLISGLKLNARFGLLMVIHLVQLACLIALYLQLDASGVFTLEHNWPLVVSVSAAVIGVYLLLAVLSSTKNASSKFNTAIARFAKGDMAARVNLTGKDEFSTIASTFNDMARDIKGMIADVSTQASAVNEAALELRGQTSEVTESSRHQRDEAAEVATTVEQTANTISVIANQTSETKQVSSKASQLSQEGSQVIREASARMESIAEAVQQSSNVITTLDKRAAEVSEIVNVIRGIAEQTNLLALNAAIEAARAGEQGRGFAVVADEVRTLAERTSQATDQISHTIDGIQESMASAATTMSQGAEEVLGGVELSSQAVATLADIHEGAEETLKMVNEISTAVTEHSESSQHIAESAERISEMAMANNQSLVSIAQQAESLDLSSQRLEQAISAFSGGTAADAKELVERAKTLIENQGEEAAFKVFCDPLKEFVDRDLYIFAYDMNGVVVAHGGNSALVGKNMMDAKDPSGKAFVAERVQVAKEKGKGWQDYVFKNPETGELEEKKSYFLRVNNVIIGCGIYN